MKRKRILIVILIISFIIILFSARVFAYSKVNLNEEKTENNIKEYSTFVAGVSIWLVILGKIISKKYYIKYENKKSYYPPNDASPIELEYFLKEKIKMKSLMALLMHFANKGYIRFEEYYEASADPNFGQLQINTKKMKIVKLKEYDGNSSLEEEYFYKIFATRDEIELDSNDDRNHINNSINKMCYNVNSKINEKKIHSKDGKNKIRILYILLGIILTLIISSIGIEDIVGSLLAIFILVFICLLLLLLFNSILMDKKFRYQEKTLLLILFAFLLFFMTFAIGMGINEKIGNSIYPKVCYSISVICLIILNIFIIKFPKKNERAYEMECKIKNYRKTLKNINEIKAEELMDHNKEYFYNTLPYAYMLDVEKKFIDKFIYFLKEGPEWFISEEEYNIYEANIIVFNKIEELINYYDEIVWQELAAEK